MKDTKNAFNAKKRLKILKKNPNRLQKLHNFALALKLFNLRIELCGWKTKF